MDSSGDRRLSGLDPAVWSIECISGKERYWCKACRTSITLNKSKAFRHEKSSQHTTSTSRSLEPSTSAACPDTIQLSASDLSGESAGDTLSKFNEFWDSFQSNSMGPNVFGDFVSQLDAVDREEFEDLDELWLDAVAQEDFGASRSGSGQDLLYKSIEKLSDWLGEPVPVDLYSSDEEFEERPFGDEEEEEPEFEILGMEENADKIGLGSRRIRRKELMRLGSPWFPWPDKVTCMLDLFMHMPRSVYSRRQLQCHLALLSELDVQGVPSAKSMKRVDRILQESCGIRGIEYKGPLGHRYVVNSMADILSQEMANPMVRPHIEFYPEDAGKRLDEARQGARWLHETDPEEVPDLLTPMYRANDGHDYYIFEPAMLRNNELCIPTRWFARDGKMYAKCWPMMVVTSMDSDGNPCSYWRVQKCDDREIEAEYHLLWNYPDACSLHESGVFPSTPHPSFIRDCYDPQADKIIPWTKPVSNKWREKANGHRVYSLPLWLYCDDTSGNQSKKWNEHNSFLFVLAGLPRTHAQKEYNVHFLCTSNIAPPLEMMDGVVKQMEEIQEEGVWAYDCVHHEFVLLLVWILALLGDNPMQSEFACHIGLRERLFCRICRAHGFTGGKDQVEPQKPTTSSSQSRPQSPRPQSPQGEPAANVPKTPNGSDAGDNAQSGSTESKARGLESFTHMLERFRTFTKADYDPSFLRKREDTKTTLCSIFDEAKSVGTRTKVENMRTEAGVKDTFQLHFLERLYSAYVKKRSMTEKQAALDQELIKLPKDIREILSPVWRILGLDPHQDTPVEILHVVLLGFIKYFWRDVVQNQIGTSQPKKQRLITNIDSMDVSGLGLDGPLSGKTLVQYSGSLTGGNFRTIVQVAPFVLYGLVSEACFDTWVSLSKLVPMIWQPSIPDIDLYTDTLRKETHNFLLTVARWSGRWFNKPKFHIFTHLPSHVPRLGPAQLFATEGFESFNAVIRSKSIHSNRQAPSRDIAAAFAQGNRIRHLFSGGFFRPRKPPSKPSKSSKAPPVQSRSDNSGSESETEDEQPQEDHFKWNPSNASAASWVQAAPNPLRLVSGGNSIWAKGIGIKTNDTQEPGKGLGKYSQRVLQATAIGRWFASKQMNSSVGLEPGLVVEMNTIISLHNGDRCSEGSHVLFQHKQHVSPSTSASSSIPSSSNEVWAVGKAKEIMTKPKAYVLVQVFNIGEPHSSYRMPTLQTIGSEATVSLKDIACTVNVQHDCITNQCDDSGTKRVKQERHRTKQAIPVISHKNPLQLILNTAQMRDAVVLQTLRTQEIMHDTASTLTTSAAAEISFRKKPADVDAKGKEPAKGTKRKANDVAGEKGSRKRKGSRANSVEVTTAQTDSTVPLQHISHHRRIAELSSQFQS